MRLIDAGALMRVLVSLKQDYAEEGSFLHKKAVNCLIKILQNESASPTIEAEPVRHGRWKLGCITIQDFVSGEYDEIFYLECPFCGRREYDFNLSACLAENFNEIVADYPYCHCGAKMDAKEGAENA